MLNGKECRLAAPIDQGHLKLHSVLKITELAWIVFGKLTHEDLKNLAMASSTTHELISNNVVR